MARALAGSYLGDLPKASREQLWNGARLTSLPAGEVLRREGDATAHLEVVVSGLVRVFVTAPDGRTMTVRYVCPGGLLGGVSLFASPFALPATLQAVTEVRLLCLDARVVRHAAETDVRVARVLIDELTERVLSFIPEIPSGAFATVPQRLARHLLDLAVDPATGNDMVASVSQRDLADAIGTVREVVVKALRRLRDAGLVRTGRDGIVILDPEGLAAEAYPGTRPATTSGEWNPGS
ncbi:Crp/Fnr family transcriptional regulator [Egicoccus sp. AB-alg2]|uniref:Crp/Fnr family transcriptional regulator n=1 Tax=Egicoccus sp. AB-alg2 TaxID=3242693 RepID=UPI00359D8F4F